MAHIIVHTKDGRGRLHVLIAVADILGLVADQVIDEETALRAIDLNTAAMRAREEAQPTRNPALRKLIAECLDVTEQGLARIYAKSEVR